MSEQPRYNYRAIVGDEKNGYEEKRVYTFSPYLAIQILGERDGVSLIEEDLQVFQNGSWIWVK